MENNKPQNPLVSLPAAIIIAGALVAIAIIWTQRPARNASVLPSDEEQGQAADIPPVSAKDHIFGNPDAPIKIVEYSDPSCPYCKVFNATMVSIMKDYGADGKVAWVYRSFPLDKPNADGRVLHPNAGKESQALECAAELGGNKSFWDYEFLFYERTPSVTSQSPKGFDPASLPLLAEEIGLDKKAFAECLDSGRTKDKVEAQFQAGNAAGLSLEGTPYSIIVSDKTNAMPIRGAQPKENIVKVLQVLLSEN